MPAAPPRPPLAPAGIPKVDPLNAAPPDRGSGFLIRIASQRKPGGHLSVRFGHNDMKSIADSPLDTCKENLARCASKTKGSVPLLLTPVRRRAFDRDGKIPTSFPRDEPIAPGPAPARFANASPFDPAPSFGGSARRGPATAPTAPHPN
jgi:hypothetical protein